MVKLSHTAVRVVSALLGLAAVALLYFFWAHKGLLLIVSVISLVTYYEFLQLLLDKTEAAWMRDMKLAVALVIGAATVHHCAWSSGTLLAPVVLSLYIFPLLALLLSHFSPAEQAQNQMGLHFREAIMQSFGLFYIVGFFCYIPRIHESREGPLWLLLLLCVVWGGDTVAYFFGKRFGKRKLSPNISPGKTVEGALANLAIGILLGALFSQFQDEGGPGLVWTMALTAVCSIAAQAGDLLESLIKRTVYAKDSGHIMPGHGGMFDRFDSLIFAAPVYWLVLQWIQATIMRQSFPL